MKYFLLVSSLAITLASFSQSKKEQIETLQYQLDSISEANRMLLVNQHEVEKLNRKTISELTREAEMLRRITKTHVYEIDSLVSRVNELEKENSILKREKSQIEVKDSGNVNSTNSNSTNQMSNNPFGGGGAFGSEGVDYDLGIYSDSGIRTAKGRTRLNNVDVNTIQIDHDATFYYKLTIDENGNVVAFSHIKSKTTTTNMILINKLGLAIKKQVKYSKEPNAPLKYVFYRIHVRTN